MSVVSYKKIFRIKITHDYFSDLIDGSISLTLGLIMEELKKRFDIQIQNIQSAYNIYINSEVSTEVFLSHLESTTSNHFFDFNIQVSNPNFYNYSDIPTDFIGTYVYESNASENRLDTNVTLLNPKINTTVSHNLLGEVKIYFHDILENPSGATTFLIALKARATFWQYDIVQSKLDRFSNLYVDGSFSNFFEGPEQVTLPNNKVAVRFITPQPLKLSEVPKYKFQLFGIRTTASALNKNLNMELPIPDGRFTITNNENRDHKVLSPMYIYL